MSAMLFVIDQVFIIEEDCC